MELSPSSLKLDYESEVARIETFIKRTVVSTLHKKGVVVAVSGGIDSSLTAALCVCALGPGRVLILLLPERDSNHESTRLGKLLADHLRVQHELLDIALILEKMGCYHYRDEAIRKVFPEYSDKHKCKIVLTQGPAESPRLNFYSIVIEGPDGHRKQCRLPLDSYLQIVAATNMKQRTRKSLEYFHADRLNYAVAGTPNFLEYSLGFFVKLGDGSADLKPIAHLYKTQVYEMARHLGLPRKLLDRKPTTDTYSLEQSQDEFFFHLPYQTLDLVLHGFDQGLEVDPISRIAKLPPDTVRWCIDDIKQKRSTTLPLHLQPLTLVSNEPACPRKGA
jgi:NAD+ synthase